MFEKGLETVVGVFVLVELVFGPSRVGLVIVTGVLCFHRVFHLVELSRFVALKQELFEEERACG